MKVSCLAVFSSGGSNREGSPGKLLPIVEDIHCLVSVGFMTAYFFKASEEGRALCCFESLTPGKAWTFL